MATRERGATHARRGGAIVKTAGLGVGLAVLAGGGVVSMRALAPAGDSRATSDVVSAATTTFDINTTATGELQAKNQIELRSELETEGSIAELAPEGSFVHKGDLIVRLNADQIQSQLDEAQLRVESAKADSVAAEKGFEIQQSENESKIRQAELKLELARLALSQWENGEKVQKLQDIALALDKTEKDLARLEEYYTKSEELYKAGFTSKNELQKDEIALREARAARQKAELDEQTYKEYQIYKDKKQKTSDVTEAEAELKRVEQQAGIQLAIKDADRVNKRRQLQLHQDKLAKLQKQMAATEVRAPQDGLVVYATSAGRNWFDDSPFTVGRRVRPQEPLIVLPDTSVMIAAVKVHESLAGRIEEGQPATVKIDAIGGRVFSGVVESIGVMAESQGRWMDPNRREYTVKVALQNVSDGVRLKPAMRCEATITLGRVESVVAVPLQAVFTDEMVRFVYVPRDGRYARVPVKVGRRSETLAEVSAGLEPGERVLVREPSPGEVLREAWDAGELKLAGFEIGEDGKPLPIGGPRPGDPERPALAGEGGSGRAGPGGRAGRAREGAQANRPGRPGGNRPAAARPEAKPAEAKPAESTTETTTTTTDTKS